MVDFTCYFVITLTGLFGKVPALLKRHSVRAASAVAGSERLTSFGSGAHLDGCFGLADLVTQRSALARQSYLRYLRSCDSSPTQSCSSVAILSY